MQKAPANSKLENVLRILYQPVPYLPDLSFLERGRHEQRKRKALARIKEKSPQERKLRGILELIGKGTCRICGHEVEINEDTWIFGDIKNGALVEMTLVNSSGSYCAKRIVVL